jgi:hypothetical protein
MEKTRQGRLVAQTSNAEQLRHQQIASQVGHMREFASLAQDALQKSHRLFSKGVRWLFDRGIRCDSGFSRTERNSLE